MFSIYNTNLIDSGRYLFRFLAQTIQLLMGATFVTICMFQMSLLCMFWHSKIYRMERKSDVFNLKLGYSFSVQEVIATAKKITSIDLLTRDHARREGEPVAIQRPEKNPENAWFYAQSKNTRTYHRRCMDLEKNLQ